MISRVKIFYFFLVFTVMLPYLSYLFPIIPDMILSFNLIGWAWILMLLVTVILLPSRRKLTFPVLLWIPWIVYLVGYIMIDFSFLGLQLTLQYLSPILVAMVASSFRYSNSDVIWISKAFTRLIILILILFAYGSLFKGGFVPTIATSPMLLSISASLALGVFFIAKSKKYLAYFFILFLVPFFSVTRMALAAFISLVVFHFANFSFKIKLLSGALGLALLFLVFNSESFQKKTFTSGSGKYSDITINYYENSKIKTTGRTTLRTALEPGLRESPIWGNGPRSDLVVLLLATGNQLKESHNDYLAVRYNYGFVGLSFFLFGMLYTFFIIYKHRAKQKQTWIWLLESSTLTLYFSFFLFMYSDNILKYTIFFPNPFFAMMGMIFSIRRYGLGSGPYDQSRPQLSQAQETGNE